MKTKILLFVSLVLIVVQGWAGPIDLSHAQSVAQNFTAANGGFYTPSVNGGLRLAYAEQSSKIKNQPVFYVFNSADSYVIVAGDDRAESILGYGEGQFDIYDIPCGMHAMFEIYKEEIEFLQTHPKLQIEKNAQDTPSLTATTATSVSPLLGSTVWAQHSPYNKQCVFNNVQCLTGCGPTALSQIMYKWKYPSTAPSMSSYSNGYTIPYLPSTTFQWSNMKSSYTKSETGTSADAVATLMRYVGHALKVRYGEDATSGGRVSVARDALVDKFGYSSSAAAVYKSSYTDDAQWHNLMKTELSSGRPIYYVANGTSCHAFVIDGYNTSNYYHINWGWSNKSYNGKYDYNGYYKLGAFNPNGTDYKFNTDQTMIIDLRPRTVVNVTPSSSYTFSSKTANKTYTWSFTVKGTYLTGGLNLKLTGATDVFSISKTNITKSAATSGATVTVTYKPTAAGTKTATITISGGGLTADKTISLKGTAVVRKITPSATSLAFGNKKLNTSTKKTFTVKGTNLSAPLTLTLTGANKGMFKIDKTSITASQAASGVTVTVTYTPTSVGNHTAKITMSSGDVDSKTVNLTGKGVKNSGGITPQPFTFEDLESLTITDFDVVSRLDSDFAMNIKPGSGVDNGNDDVLMAPSNPSTSVNELEMNSKIYADGLNIIIESPVEQKAVISDIAGHIREVNLQAGRNEIPVNASGIYIVRIREKSTKLMLK